MDSNKQILLCTDLDRTLLPNGPQAASPMALPLFKQLITRPEVKLAYVSGRDKQLLLKAIEEFDIPIPDYAIADVGTTIYSIHNHDWQIWDKWHEEIAMDWGCHTQTSLSALLQDIKEIQLQEENKQAKYKLSYYVNEQIDTSNLFKQINTLFHNRNIKANLIWSIDETTHTGLLDILPQSANKLHAIRFLIAQNAYSPDYSVFAGDSGNDLEVLCSDIQSVLVANASPEVRRQAVELARANSQEAKLYLAQGDFLGMNGNYVAGILEGVAHYLPVTIAWIKPKN